MFIVPQPLRGSVYHGTLSRYNRVQDSVSRESNAGEHLASDTVSAETEISLKKSIKLMKVSVAGKRKEINFNQRYLHSIAWLA